MKNFQITVDGVAEQHDYNRPGRDGLRAGFSLDRDANLPEMLPRRLMAIGVGQRIDGKG